MERLIETLQLFGSLTVGLVSLFVPISVGIVLLQRWVGPLRLQRWLGGSSLPFALIKGTALGAVTPFCGCSTVPLLLGLLKANVRFAAVAAFMLASPLLNPYILGVVTLLFGWNATVVYASVAVGTTLVIATLWEILGLDRYLAVPGYRPTTSSRRRGVVTVAPVPALANQRSVQDAGCASGPADDAAAWRGMRNELMAARRESVGMLRPMLRPMLIGMVIGALIYGAVPEGAVASLLGSESWFTLPLAAVLGLPLYLRGEAAFPIGAALMSAGVGEAPMFAMVIAGMGASLPEVMLLSGIFERRLLGAFLASVFAMAVAGGLLIPPLV